MNGDVPIWRRLAIALIVYSILATLALVWLLGRESKSFEEVPKQALLATSPSPRPVVAQPASAPKPTVQYPLFQSTVPKPFRGGWDEIIIDKCADREARFYLNFEVRWEVTKAKLYSPTEMDLYATTYDDNKNQVDEVWQFKLVDDGRTLTGRKAGASFFKRCPKT